MREESSNLIIVKSMNFAIRCVNLKKYLNNEKHEFDIARQLFRSGTSIGANTKEALRGQSKSDFRAKMNISLKEASESEYWIDLLFNTDYIDEKEYMSLKADCIEILKILTSIVKNSAEDTATAQL